MRIALPYGAGTLPFTVPAGAAVLEPSPAPPLGRGSLVASLERPLAGPALAALARGRRRACVVVSDSTRPGVGAWVVPAVCEVLERSGVGRIDLVVATGTHRAATAAEAPALVGAACAARWGLRSHDCECAPHEHVGTTATGVPVWIDRGYVRADLRLVVGVVEPHLLAGFSGGAKSVCPGLARLDTIQGVHRDSLANGCVGPGIVRGNPFRAEVAAAAAMAGVDFSIQVCVDGKGDPTHIAAGTLPASVDSSTSFAARHFRVSIATAQDVVVVTAGGAPLDRTLYQAAKGWAAGAGILRPGGHLILLAELGEGLGSPAFTALLAATPAERVGRIGSWMAHHIEQLRQRAHLHVVSSLATSRLEECGFAAHSSLEAALSALLPRGEAAVAVLPRGPFCVAAVGSGLRTLSGAEAVA